MTDPSRPDTATASLTVTRRADSDVQERQVILSLDGEPLATLLFGQEVTRRVLPGAHRLRANNTLVWKTVEFDIADGEHARFRVVNRPGFGTRALAAVIGVGPIYLTLERER